MAYTLKDVFYLGATHVYPASVYGSSGIEGNIPIDISAYVNSVGSKGRRGQGLAVYKVHCQVAGDVTGNILNNADAGSGAMGLTVKPYTTSGDNSSALQSGDLTPESDLLIYGAFMTAPATAVPGNGVGMNAASYLEPSEDVPYVCVRDTIFQIFETTTGLSTNDDWYISYRLECAMIKLDTATLNQLLRTQTA